jgi:hypothetical protein
MIIDLILDRRDGAKYDPREMYDEVRSYESLGEAPDTGVNCISLAMDNGEEPDVRRALKHYVKVNGYNPDICKYIDSVKWL